MNMQKRLDMAEQAAREQVRHEWAVFWAQFTNAEVEILAFEPSSSTKPEAVQAREKFDRLGGHDLVKRSEAIGEKGESITLEETAAYLLGRLGDSDRDKKIILACADVMWLAEALGAEWVTFEPGETPRVTVGPKCPSEDDQPEIIGEWCEALNDGIIDADPPLPTGAKDGFEWCKMVYHHLSGLE